jgi:hypothetical protein
MIMLEFLIHYLRQTKTEYDNFNVNQICYEGDNKMGSF